MKSIFDALDRYEAADEAARTEIEQELWRRHGRKAAVFMLDMAEFSLSVRRYGVIHHLAMIRRMQKIVTAIAAQHRGQIMGFEADNAALLFDDVAPAVRAGLAINRELAQRNQSQPPRCRIRCAIGIAYGQILLLPDRHFAGDPVNMAAKLGEDLAKADEILIEESAFHRLPEPQLYPSEAVTFQISGLDLRAHAIQYPLSPGSDKT